MGSYSVSIVSKLVIEFFIPLEQAVRKYPIYSPTDCSDQLTALGFNWEKAGRRQEEIAEHKLNKQINSVAYYNQNKIEHDLFFLLAYVSCEGVLIFFLNLTA